MPSISLEVATAAAAQPLADLLEVYVEELSGIFAVKADPDGRFRYHKLSLYWEATGMRFAYFIRVGGDRVGFALVTRESPTADAADRFDVSEFFVLRPHRRGGIGRHSAFLLWDRLYGQWVVRVSEGNAAALPFWFDAVRDYTGGAFAMSHRRGEPHDWRVFEFRSRGISGGPDPTTAAGDSGSITMRQSNG